jgi:hypothetical protein
MKGSTPTAAAEKKGRNAAKRVERGGRGPLSRSLPTYTALLLLLLLLMMVMMMSSGLMTQPVTHQKMSAPTATPSVMCRWCGIRMRSMWGTMQKERSWRGAPAVTASKSISPPVITSPRWAEG